LWAQVNRFDAEEPFTSTLIVTTLLRLEENSGNILASLS
jgi:hypothetical protein